MIDLQKFIVKLKNLKAFSEKEAFTILREDLKPVIEDMNTEQLNNGMRADGKILPDYSEASVQIYGKPSGPIKLLDSGKFHSSITAIIEPNEIKITSTDSKFTQPPADLEFHYGSEILGLTERNIEELTDGYLIPHLIEKIENYFEK